jgi:hypothetical protein
MSPPVVRNVNSQDFVKACETPKAIANENKATVANMIRCRIQLARVVDTVGVLIATDYSEPRALRFFELVLALARLDHVASLCRGKHTEFTTRWGRWLHRLVRSFPRYDDLRFCLMKQLLKLPPKCLFVFRKLGPECVENMVNECGSCRLDG